MAGKPTLVVYSFAAKRTPSNPDFAREARDYLNKLWLGCDDLGMRAEVEGLNVSTEFPALLDEEDSQLRFLAAKKDLDLSKDNQAFLFEYHDIRGFVATLEGDSTSNPAAWKNLFAQWSPVVGPSAPPPGVIEEIYLFSEFRDSKALLTPETKQPRETLLELGRNVLGGLPGSGANSPPDRVYVTAEAYHIWESEAWQSRRVIGLLAPLEKEDDLFRWAVWPPYFDLAPFVRYLIHAAKLRFAEGVFRRDLPKIQLVAQRLDDALKRLTSLYGRSENPTSWDLDNIEKAHNQLVDEQTRNFDLLFDITRLKELLLTAQIALRNMNKCVPAKHEGAFAGDVGLFAEDRRRGVRLREQIRIDLAYLTAFRERAREGHRVAGRRLEHQSHRTARRLNNLVLLHVTLLGSLTIGLLMLPAFEVFHEERNLVWALTGLLMALGLAVPPLFARWHEAYKPVDLIVGGLFSGALVFFLVTLWETLHLPTLDASPWAHLVFKILSFGLGFLIGLFVVQRIEGLKSKNRLKTRHPIHD